MSIQYQEPKDDKKSHPPEHLSHEESLEVVNESTTPPPINLQKRDYELDAVRFGDWELNGRCIDF
jgi:hypothetical protein